MTPSHRYEFIDSLRAVAVLAVLIMHVTEVYVNFISPVHRNGEWLFTWAHEFNFGRIGVLLFFIISGFVIPGSFSASGDRKEGALKFLVSRFFRLFPLFWISIALSLPTQNWGSGKYPSLSDILLNATMVPAFFGVTEINGAYWTLAVELVFYGMCFILFVAGFIRNQTVLAALCLILTYSFIDLQYFHHFKFLEGRFDQFPTFLGFMFWGALCRIRFEQKTLSRFAEFAFWTFAIGWMFVFPMAGFHEAHVRHHAEVDFVARVYGANFAAFMIFFISYNFFQIKNAILIYLGKISYSIYLLQGAVIHGCVWIILHYFPGIVGKFSLFYSLPLISALTIAASIVTYHGVELPAQRLAKRINKRITATRYARSEKTVVESPV